MRILNFSSLFPNSEDPVHGIFVHRRVAGLAAIPGVTQETIAPIPFFPKWIKARRWSRFAAVPEREFISALEVHHPRYPLLPGISMPLHGVAMFIGAKGLALRLHREHPFDCIAAQYVYPDGFAAVLLGKMLRIPVVVWALGSDINLFLSFSMIKPQIRWTLGRAAGIVTVSSALKSRILDLGLPEGKVRFIGNGVDSELFRITSRNEARRALGLSDASADKIMVSVASLKEAKGLHHVINALARIASSFPRLKLYVIGDGEYRPTLEKLVRDLGLTDRVYLLGRRGNQEISLWFNAADVSILASSREGWPNVILESLACGTPVIGTPVGQIPEILNSPDLGIVTSQQPDLLAAAIKEALRRSWDRETLMNFAHSRPWRTVALESEEYLRSIIGGQKLTASKAFPAG